MGAPMGALLAAGAAGGSLLPPGGAISATASSQQAAAGGAPATAAASDAASEHRAGDHLSCRLTDFCSTARSFSDAITTHFWLLTFRRSRPP